MSDSRPLPARVHVNIVWFCSTMQTQEEARALFGTLAKQHRIPTKQELAAARAAAQAGGMPGR
jgi:hypothetical protein